MKRKFKMMYFFADWDNNFSFKSEMFEECKARNIYFDCIDCETPEGVALSIKYKVKLCPYIILMKNGKEVWRGVANEINLDEFAQVRKNK